jgi:hypothetical protein
MKSSIFLDIKSCNPVKFNRRLGGKYRLHLQGETISQARNEHEENSKQSSSFCPLPAEDGGDISSDMSVDFDQTTRRDIPEYKSS